MLPALLVVAVILWVADQTVGDARAIWRTRRRRRQ